MAHTSYHTSICYVRIFDAAWWTLIIIYYIFICDFSRDLPPAQGGQGKATKYAVSEGFIEFSNAFV